MENFIYIAWKNGCMDSVHDSPDYINAISVLIENVMDKDHISFSQIIALLKKKRKQGKIIVVPSCIFRERSLGILEAMTKYLKEELKVSYHDIGSLLNRDERSIWISYKKARSKLSAGFVIDRTCLSIPVSIFVNRRLGLLENLTLYLKENLDLKNREIAKLLNRDNRTIWACYNRAKKKNERN